MTQREKYKLEFVWITGPVSNKLTPHAKAVAGANRLPTGGVKSYHLSTILNTYERSSVIDSIVTDVNTAISHPGLLDDSWSLDDGTYVAAYGGNLVFGSEDSPTNPANYTIPLSDFKNLLLEWKSFVTSK